jgi:hypothetical protein
LSGEHIQSATIRPAGTVSLDCTLMNSPTLISDHITDLKSDEIICDENDEEGSDDDEEGKMIMIMIMIMMIKV